MSKTIKSLFLISVMLFALLRSGSSQKLRRLDVVTSYTFGETDTLGASNENTDSFVLDENESTEPLVGASTDNAANYDLGDADPNQAPGQTATQQDSTVGTAAPSSNVVTSFVLGDAEEPQTVSTTQNTVGTSSESKEFDLGDAEETVGATTSTSTVTSFELTEDNTVGASNPNAGEQSFDLNEDDTVGTSASNDNSETSFDLNEGDTVGSSNSNVATSYELTEDNTVGASASNTNTDESSFDLVEDNSVGASITNVNTETAFDLKEDDNTVGVSTSTANAGQVETTFELKENDDEKNVDLTDPATASNSTDNTGVDENGRALGSSAEADATVTTTTTNNQAKSGVSLQTGLVMALVAVVSALML